VCNGWKHTANCVYWLETHCKLCVMAGNTLQIVCNGWKHTANCV